MIFSEKLLNWYKLNLRSLPWRETKDPYKIWISEIILQQTKIEQGLPYYKKFIKKYPTVLSLAKANENDIIKLWQGLGYYSRAQNLFHTAKKIATEFNGVFPKTQKEMMKLRGIGDYTASAIGSICFNNLESVVDGNVYRFLGRYFGINMPINTFKTFKFFKSIANKLIPPDTPGDFNQAMMDFGSIQCKPKNPSCSSCVFSKSCYALNTCKITSYPVKQKKNKIKTRHFNYLFIHNSKNQTVLKKRLLKGIWQKLYEFPLVETNVILKKPNLEFKKIINKYAKKDSYSITPLTLKPITHKLSHQILKIQFWKILLLGETDLPVKKNKIMSYPVPVVIEKFIDQFYKTVT